VREVFEPRELTAEKFLLDPFVEETGSADVPDGGFGEGGLEDGHRVFGAERRSVKDTRISHRVGETSAVSEHAGVGEAVG